MSRSRPSQCSGGRGCWVCGDAGEVRRARELEAGASDLDAGLEQHATNDPHDGANWYDNDGDPWDCEPVPDAEDDGPLRVAFADVARFTSG